MLGDIGYSCPYDPFALTINLPTGSGLTVLTYLRLLRFARGPKHFCVRFVTESRNLGAGLISSRRIHTLATLRTRTKLFSRISRQISSRQLVKPNTKSSQPVFGFPPSKSHLMSHGWGGTFTGVSTPISCAMLAPPRSTTT